MNTQLDPQRPHDVDTGVWLWLAALPLAVIGYVISLVTTARTAASGHGSASPGVIYVSSGLMVFVVAVLVVTFLVLLRQGYRWARSILTGGSAFTIVFLASGLFGDFGGAAAAVGYAVCAIGASVLIGGGVYLLHRPDSTKFFTR
ncbi:hypothetical protein [Mycobacterium sp. OTB74]|uniref:hypothetical protein n=1 Tax=Mycobacterium sp. OTB74 TaxID=1853452 RepID=UPI002476C54E|nr:hypothetical protein [Mycobacterium sp. OTB74]MDH6246313.1 hypothetical protein [Mycobacterium sp. OTB74]